MIDIVQALDDPNLFGPWFSGPSWSTWKAVLKGAFCIPMDEGERKLFRAVAERDPPKKRVRELWAIVGGRGGKDSIASAIACYAAGFIDYRKVLRPGERASVLCLAVDKAHPDPAKLKRAGSLKIKDQFPMVTEFALSQARVIVRYAPELANASPRFRRA
jgi:hypothetical protein